MIKDINGIMMSRLPIEWEQSLNSLVVGQILDERKFNEHNIVQGWMIKDINGIMMSRFKETKRPLARQNTFVKWNFTDNMRMCEWLSSFLRKLIGRFRFFRQRGPAKPEFDAAVRCIMLLEHLRMVEEIGHG